MLRGGWSEGGVEWEEKGAGEMGRKRVARQENGRVGEWVGEESKGVGRRVGRRREGWVGRWSGRMREGKWEERALAKAAWSGTVRSSEKRWGDETRNGQGRVEVTFREFG